jgi:hypothetical protein
MKNTTNKNLIYAVATFVFVLVFSVASPVSARTVTMDTGATFNGSSANEEKLGDNNEDTLGNEMLKLNPSPVINSLSPNEGISGSGSKTIAIYGRNFVPNSVARFNGNGRPTSYVNSTKLLMTLSSTDMSGLGNNLVSVLNPAPGGGFSNTATFTLNKAQTVSTVSNVSNTTNTTTKNTTTKTTTKSTATKKTADTRDVVACSTDTNKDGSLAAGVIFGSSDFLPKNGVQWIFFLILMFLAIILVRKLFFTQKRNTRPAYQTA